MGKQLGLPIGDDTTVQIAPFKKQLLKWVGNKQRMAHQIASLFPADMASYHEVFLGSGAVLGTLKPERAFASDSLSPLMEIWLMLAQDPQELKDWYFSRRRKWTVDRKVDVYEEVKADFNANPNGADLLFLCRACYGGVVRFRKDGFMSTPCGAHTPISSEAFAARVDEWSYRTSGTTFRHLDYRKAMSESERGDVIYCDPPYSDTQAILYGAQAFSLHELLEEIDAAKGRGVRVAMSIDGSKKSGLHEVLHDFPEGLFASEVEVSVGRSMLRRFQRSGESLGDEIVHDRLLLTY